MKRSLLPVSRSLGVLASALLIVQACGLASTRAPSGTGQDAAAPTGGASGGGTGGIAFVVPAGTGGMPMHVFPCVGLQCQQTDCAGNCKVPACLPGQSTTLNGFVYDPAGKVPLYNINVYVPNSPLAALPDGATCDRCDTPVSGDPIAKALTDASGHFSLQNPPVGTNIPLVLQIGKWRRQVMIPNITACVDNNLADKNLTRLPKNQSEGHIPKIALTTGGADALECLLRKIGIEDAEFTTETGTGRINLFNGQGGTASYAPTLNAGAMFTPAPTWWETNANLMKYDIVLHSCEGTERPTNKSIAARQALLDYANAGGRIFASHWHNYWLEFGTPPLPTVAVFNHQGALNTIVSTIDTSFPKGLAMADWLVNVGGSTVHGQLPIVMAKHTVDAVNPMVSQRWIYYDMPASVQYFTTNTPIGTPPDKQCGRIVFSDIHVSSGVGDMSSPGNPFPTGCVTVDLSPQEKALEFMLFDLSSCVKPDAVPIP